MSFLRSFAIAVCVVSVSAERGELELARFTVDNGVPEPPAPVPVPRRRFWNKIKSWGTAVYDHVVEPTANAVVDTTVDWAQEAYKGTVSVGTSIFEFTMSLIGPDGFSEQLAREWLGKRIGGNKKVQDVLKHGHSVMKSYKQKSCNVKKSVILPLLRDSIKGQNDGVLYVGSGVSGGLGYGESKSTGVFIDHNGFEGCYTTTCKYFGLHAGGGVGIEAGYLHGEGTNDMPGDATAAGASFDLGPGLDVVGGFTSGGKGFVELGTGKGVGVNLGSHFECNTKIHSTNTNTCQVTLYQHDNFTGSSRSYGTGSVPLVWRNDDVSSIKVHGHGCEAIVYEHGDYAGWSVRLPKGHYTLSQLRAKGFRNDDMSSLKVQRTRRRTEELLVNRLARQN